MNESQLVRAIKAHIEKGDKAAEKSEQHYITAGQHLKTLKAQMPQGIKWEQYLEDHGLTIGRRGADELIQIADGRTTIEKVRADKAESVAKSRAALALRSAEDADEPQASAEAMKVKFAETEKEDSFLDDDGDFAPVDPAADDACRIRGFLYRAQQSTFAAEADELKGLVCTSEMVEAARKVITAWTALLQEMNRRAPVEDGSASKPQPNIATPSPEPASAIDPWDGLDIPASLRRDLPPKQDEAERQYDAASAHSNR
jgi:hypothetical protein